MTDVRRGSRRRRREARAALGPVIGRASLVLVAAAVGLAALLGLLAVGPPSATELPRCPVLAGLPPVPSVDGATPPDLIAGGSRLALQGRLDQAERLYDAALASTPPDPRAGPGLAYVEARRAQAVDRASQGQRALEEGHPARAWSCFLRALEHDSGNEAAREGLATLRAADTRNVAERLADGWDGVYERWLSPVGGAIGPFLAVLAVLLVLARLLTPLAVPVTATAWPDPVRRVAWTVGTGLLVVAAARMTVFADRPPSDWEAIIGDEWRVGALVLVVSLAALLFGWSSYGRPWWLTLGGLALVLLALGFVGWGLAQQWMLGVPERLWPAALAVAMALLGVVLVAAGRGHALRLRVTVKRGETPDPAGTEYVLARLQELGTSPPEGLKAPQQVDITDLPASALSGLPGGKVATALASTVRLVQAAVPWQATVQDGGDGRMVVTVTRNGPVVRVAIVDGQRFRETAAGRHAATSEGADGASVPDQTREPRNLLTAAAAVILTELAVKHPRLKKGLCGATQWDSVAAHVVATRPQLPVGTEDFQGQLLGFAVQRDPGNALARAALVQRLGNGARERPEFEAHAMRLYGLLRTIDGQRPGRSRKDEPRPAELEQDDGDGYTPLRLRTLHAMTAAWLNAAACEGASRSSRYFARTAYRRLHALLDDIPRTTMAEDPFLGNLCSVADELREGLLSLGSPVKGLPKPFHTDDADRPRSLSAVYDRACRRAWGNQSDEELRAALEDLRLAVGDPRLRKQAQTDPWLRSLRESTGEDADVSATFWQIVGGAEPVPPFTGLPPFGAKGEALRALGLGEPADLVAATWAPGQRRELAGRLGVPVPVVKRWRTFAQLAVRRGSDRKPLTSSELDLLVRAGITEPGQLARRVRSAASWEKLRDDLRKQGLERRTPLSAAAAEAIIGQGRPSS